MEVETGGKVKPANFYAAAVCWTLALELRNGGGVFHREKDDEGSGQQRIITFQGASVCGNRKGVVRLSLTQRF